jgi:hypothetical protein
VPAIRWASPTLQGTASRCSSPTSPTPTPPSWRPATVPTPTWRTAEDRIRGAKASGLRNLPFWGFAANDAWLTLVCVAQTLVCWAQALLLSGDCKLAEPKTLRYRLWHVAGRIVRHARRLIVRLDRAWPWAADLVTAFARLRALPARC